MLPREMVQTLVGQPYIEEKDGYAWKCLAPMYEVIPETLNYRYELSEWDNILEHFKKECQEVSLEDMQYGDILIIKMPLTPFHLMVYLGDGKALHCVQTGMEIIPIERYKKKVKGVFRYGISSSCGNCDRVNRS